MSEKVSVIVPVYNTAAYLEKCLDSLLNQTYPDVEVLAVDDGSTDGSRELLRQHAERDSRLRVLEQSHGGVSAAKNQALNAMTGDYLMFVDSDDWIEPDTVEALLTLIGDKDVVYFNTTNELKEGPQLRVSSPVTGEADQLELVRQAALPTDEQGRPCGYFLCITNKFFRVSSLRAAPGGLGYFDPKVRILEDGVWLSQHFGGLKSGALCGKGYYHRIFRSDSAMGNPERGFETQTEYLRGLSVVNENIRAIGLGELADECERKHALSTLRFLKSLVYGIPDRETAAARVEEALKRIDFPRERELLSQALLMYRNVVSSVAYKRGVKLNRAMQRIAPIRWLFGLKHWLKGRGHASPDA